MKRAFPIAFAFLGFATLGAGCGNTGGGGSAGSGDGGSGPGGKDRIELLCGQVCACDCGGSCLDEGRAAEQVAIEEDCEGELDAFLGCVNEKSSCSSLGNWQAEACADAGTQLATCSHDRIRVETKGHKPLDVD